MPASIYVYMQVKCKAKALDVHILYLLEVYCLSLIEPLQVGTNLYILEIPCHFGDALTQLSSITNGTCQSCSAVFLITHQHRELTVMGKLGPIPADFK